MKNYVLALMFLGFVKLFWDDLDLNKKGDKKEEKTVKAELNEIKCSLDPILLVFI